MEELAAGTGAAAEPGREITIHYTVRLSNRSELLDSTRGGHPFSFVLGRGELVKGLDLGLVGMKVHGRRRVTVPPELAYGARGMPPKIPGGATLVYEIELVDVGDARGDAD
ncbi:MAG TPA: FKBP-type peptidyl-prolyl cis-trans isomerase [Minicystis sp.]|nr:FKBP-type peptidyl-prolyl cis-trans isomerase [Minicystis sp.]